MPKCLTKVIASDIPEQSDGSWQSDVDSFHNSNLVDWVNVVVPDSPLPLGLSLGLYFRGRIYCADCKMQVPKGMRKSLSNMEIVLLCRHECDLHYCGKLRSLGAVIHSIWDREGRKSSGK